MKKSLFLAVLLVSSLGVFAQQDPYYTQYMFNRLSLNPAYAGSQEGMEATLLHHQQWVGYPENAGPSTQVLGINAPFGRHGLGVNFVNDKLGFEKSVNLMLSYNFKFNLGTGHTLAVGPGVGFLQKSIDGSKLTPEQAFDLKIPTSNVSSIKPDFSLGAYYQNENLNKLYVGVSALHLSEEDFNYEGTQGMIAYTGARHYYLMAGMSFDLGANLALRPNLLLKNDGATTQFDINADLLVNERFRGGFSYRSDDAMSVLLGAYIVPAFHVGYSYDFTLTDIRTVSSGTHEIVLNYVLKWNRNPRPAGPTKIILTPRSLD